MPAGQPRRRFVFSIIIASFFLMTLFVLHFRNQPLGARDPTYKTVPIHEVEVSAETLQGAVVAQKLGNETLKAELGRAAWKLLHTTMARFPDKPERDESTALQSYIHLFARLYPCGECAGHFREILSKFPPQVSSRSTAAAWACHVHNEVNRSLNKPIFDCSKIGDFYDCGCADDDKEDINKMGAEKPEMADESKKNLAGEGRRLNDDLLKDLKPLEPLHLEKEGKRPTLTKDASQRDKRRLKGRQEALAPFPATFPGIDGGASDKTRGAKGDEGFQASMFGRA
ncbi:MAG: hypothetical protein M1833_006395 [Piccolia ochrophora]|nr:MAG: hypothetical protein M1833_006395 [Piccolia ochrophora]